MWREREVKRELKELREKKDKEIRNKGEDRRVLRCTL